MAVHLHEFWTLPTTDSPNYKNMTQSGKGTVTLPIQESGLYRIGFKRKRKGRLGPYLFDSNVNGVPRRLKAK